MNNELIRTKLIVTARQLLTLASEWIHMRSNNAHGCKVQQDEFNFVAALLAKHALEVAPSFPAIQGQTDAIRTAMLIVLMYGEDLAEYKL